MEGFLPRRRDPQDRGETLQPESLPLALHSLVGATAGVGCGPSRLGSITPVTGHPAEASSPTPLTGAAAQARARPCGARFLRRGRRGAHFRELKPVRATPARTGRGSLQGRPGAPARARAARRMVTGIRPLSGLRQENKQKAEEGLWWGRPVAFLGKGLPCSSPRWPPRVPAPRPDRRRAPSRARSALHPAAGPR